MHTVLWFLALHLLCGSGGVWLNAYMWERVFPSGSLDNGTFSIPHLAFPDVCCVRCELWQVLYLRTEIAYS